MRDLTLIHPYYENPGMLREQQRMWASYPDDLKARLSVIVVDDGSPLDPAVRHLAETGVSSFTLYRTLVDVRWNWIFCRNLAMAQMQTAWALMTDIDHVLPADTLRCLLERDLDPATAYTLSRVDAPDRRPNPKPHPNTWLMTRTVFERAGGYDERFSGYYGTDGEFRRRVAKVAPIVLLPEVLIRYPKTVLADAETSRYGRKERQDAVNVPKILLARKDRAPLRVTFPWERVT